jgi:predicted double-glycine peptidase
MITRRTALTVGFAFAVSLGREGVPQDRPRIKNWLELRNEHVVIQQHDYSCGSAALSTMFRYYFQDNIPEARVLQVIFFRLAQRPDGREQVVDRVKQGLSMLDLKLAAIELGYQAEAAKIPLKTLATVDAPVIVRIEEEGFKHFVIFRGVLEDRVFLADPVRGNLRIPISKFNMIWTKVDGSFVTHSGEDVARPALFLGKEGFGLPKQHPLAITQPIPFIEMKAARDNLYRPLPNR